MSQDVVRLGLTAAVATAIACFAARAGAGFGAPPAATTGPYERDAPASPEPTPSGDAHDSAAPASRYGQLEADACEAELARRGASFVRVESARGVLAPLRLTGPLHGVAFHSGVPASQRASAPWEIVDCRLALALDDFAQQLSVHDVVEVVHYSIYRPPSSEWPADQIARQHA